METDSQLARFSLVSFDPAATLSLKNNVFSVQEHGESTQEIESKQPFREFSSLSLVKNRRAGFVGGFVGYASYDCAKYFLPIQPTANSSLFPDAEYGLFLDGVVFDRLDKKISYVHLGKSRLELVRQMLRRAEYSQSSASPRPFSFKKTRQLFSQKQYEEKVLLAKERIAAGESFQTVLSNRFEYDTRGSRLSFYEQLRRLNPSPYMYFLKFGEREIVGSSPEMLVRVEQGTVETFPIAGTRSRGAGAAEDRRLEKELLADEKERAEHLMLVDLARNDVGKIAEFGSVKVPEYFSVKKFSHVQHIVSKVTGRLRPGLSAVDALSSLFPAGTVSGAPKIRSMEIIDELEATSRGPYAGAVGYFSLNGNADFAITIRTLFGHRSQSFLQAGAGIVFDSKPEAEYKECLKKAAALEKALELAANQDAGVEEIPRRGPKSAARSAK